MGTKDTEKQEAQMPLRAQRTGWGRDSNNHRKLHIITSQETTLSFVGPDSKTGGSKQLWDAQQRELGGPHYHRGASVCLTLSILHSFPHSFIQHTPAAGMGVELPLQTSSSSSEGAKGWGHPLLSA